MANQYKFKNFSFLTDALDFLNKPENDNLQLVSFSNTRDGRVDVVFMEIQTEIKNPSSELNVEEYVKKTINFGLLSALIKYYETFKAIPWASTILEAEHSELKELAKYIDRIKNDK